MDWNELKRFQKSSKRLGNFIEENFEGYSPIIRDEKLYIVNHHDYRDTDKFDYRNLYDFFDDAGIIISVWFDKNIKKWDWEIVYGNSYFCDLEENKNGYSTRYQAEVSAFLSAFEEMERFFREIRDSKL